MDCKYCKVKCIKKGFQKNGVQKFYCNTCHKYQQHSYKYQACCPHMTSLILRFKKLGCGIRDLSRGLRISTGTIIKRILAIGSQIDPGKYLIPGKIYLVDELSTFIGNKENRCWITCAMEKNSKKIVSLKIGSRTKENLQYVITPLLQTNPEKIYTDRLPTYKSIIPKKIHIRNRYKINLLERRFLNFRTHLKRLARKSICYSKKIEMLEACVKIYLWEDLNYTYKI